MAFTQITFLGASVSSFGSSISWNGEGASQLNVVLVEDKGQRFTRPDTGSPQTFEFGQFKFRGLIQNWIERNSPQGKPIFEVRLTDASQVLAGAQVIVNSYSGNTLGIDNILNVFGLFEQAGFGSAGANEAGMPWDSPVVASVRQGLERMINGGATAFGGPLKFRGTKFKIDFTEMPKPPSFYRIGGNANISLLEIISQVCFDSGFDFFFELDANNKIIVKTVSRVAQPKLGPVESFINQETAKGQTASNTKGRESRNETAVSFIAGGPRSFLRELSAQPYWGTNLKGNPITGESPVLNAASIKDIIQSNSYPTTIVELRAALGNQDTWTQYLTVFRPAVAKLIGVGQPYKLGALSEIADFGMAKSDKKKDVEKLAWFPTDHQSRIRRVYEFVRQHASEFYGKKFLVQLPFIAAAIESETFRIITNEQVTNAAFEGVAPIGGLESLLFKTDDGRFQTFCQFTDLSKADFSNINLGDDAVFQKGKLFLRCSVDSDIIFKSGIQPFVLISLPSVLRERKQNMPFGDLDFIATIMGSSKEDVEEAGKKASANLGVLRVDSPAKFPTSFFIPFESNALVYGPFVSKKNNDGGKVNFQVDSSLVPWNFAGLANMNTAGQLLADAATTGMVEAETGSVELVGEPIITLGETLVKGGANVTNISIRFGSDGVRTNYEMRTYTPKFGLFSKNFIDRIRKLSGAQQDSQNNIRKSLKEKILKRQLGSSRPPINFLENALSGTNLKNMSRVNIGAISKKKGKTITSVVSTDEDNGIGAIRAGTDDFGKCVGFASQEAILRPFATDKNFEGDLPHYEEPDEDFSLGLHVDKIDPFQEGHDIAIAAEGDDSSWDVFSKGGPANIRPICLRGPLVLSGWGFNMAAASGDATDPQPPEDFLEEEFLRNPDKWKTGPVDLLWDDKRKVWTAHGKIAGTISEDIASGESGEITVFSDIDSETSWKIKVHNFFTSDITVNGDPIKVFADYFPHLNKFLISAVDCLTGSTNGNGPQTMKMAPPEPEFLQEAPELSASEWDRLVRLVEDE